MAERKYVDYAALQRLVSNINEKFAPIAALQFKGIVANIEALPVLNTQKVGYIYNVTTGGGTTSDFVEGAGHVLRDGDNVVVVNVGTEQAPTLKWDILAGVFKIEDRLQFGTEMPLNPTNGQTFLYLGELVYNYNEITPIGTESPVEEGWYELVEGSYVLSEDATIEVGKTYYTRGTEKYVPGVIYVYDGTGMKWDAQTAGDTFVPITTAEIDALFV